MAAINLNNPNTVTTAAVQALIASKDDTADRQLRVMDDGDVILSDVVGNIALTGVRSRYEIWHTGNGYSGKRLPQTPSGSIKFAVGL